VAGKSPPSAISQAVTTLGYHPNGTLKTVTGPANAKGERYALNYRYDAPNQQYVTRTEDTFGRTDKVWGPYDIGGRVPTFDLLWPGSDQMNPLKYISFSSK
jgi:hypothetical protein